VFGIFGPVVVLLVFDRFLAAASGAAAYAVAVLAGLLIAGALAVFEGGHRRVAFALGVLWFPISFAALVNGPYLTCAERHSQRALAREISHRQPLPQRLVMIGEEVGSLLFYLSPDERAWFRNGRIVETDGRTLDKLASMPPGCVIAITDKELDRTLHAEAVRRLWPALAGRFRIIEPAAASFAQRPADETGGRK
jgi:hypothetical protein